MDETVVVNKNKLQELLDTCNSFVEKDYGYPGFAVVQSAFRLITEPTDGVACPLDELDEDE